MPDDLCDLCMSSGVTVERTTFCGKTIGVECGCDDHNDDGTCGEDDCEVCADLALLENQIDDPGHDGYIPE